MLVCDAHCHFFSSRFLEILTKDRRDLPPGDHAAVVALTGHALAGISEGAKRAGCDAFVTKPCLPEDLVKEIRKVLEHTAATAAKRTRRSGKYAKTTG